MQIRIAGTIQMLEEARTTADYMTMNGLCLLYAWYRREPDIPGNVRHARVMKLAILLKHGDAKRMGERR